MIRTLLFILAVSSLAVAAQARPGGKTEKKAVAAKRGDLRATVEAKGVLVPAEYEEISLWLDEYRGELLVLDALPEGTPVNEGDVLVRLDMRRIEEQLDQAKFDLKQQDVKHRHGKEKARLAREAAHEELKRAEVQNDRARRRLQGYREHETRHKKERERLRTQSENNRLEDQQDELTQLEKMYKEDELVDATEEIVLKRSRRSLAAYRANVKLQRDIRAYSRSLNEVIQREDLEMSVIQHAAALERKRRSTEMAETDRKLSTTAATRNLKKKERALDRLRHDRERMVVRAPHRGILLHGTAKATPGSGKLKRGSTLRPRQVFLTVARPDRFKVILEIPEKDIFRARTGKAAEIRVPALEDARFTGSIRVAPMATGRNARSGNVYEAEIPLAKSDPCLRMRMQCKVTVIVEEVKNAVLVPVGAVVRGPDGAFVKCGKKAAGPFEKRRVVLGACDDRHVVVQDGIEAGEFVQVCGKGEK